MRFGWTITALAAVCVSAPGKAPAQTVDDLTEALVSSDRLHGERRPLASLEAAQTALADAPGDYAALWRAARGAVNLGMLTGDEEAAHSWYREAVGYARAAVAADSTGLQGREWLAIALGRQALMEGAGERVRLVEEVRRHAMVALAIDSTSAPAHEVLGQWHAEIRRLSGLTRFAARTFLGADTFDRASWEQAEFHLRRAVEFAPEGVIHRVSLGRLLLDRERPAEAREQLEVALELPLTQPADPLHRREAERLLQSPELRKSASGHP